MAVSLGVLVLAATPPHTAADPSTAVGARLLVFVFGAGGVLLLTRWPSSTARAAALVVLAAAFLGLCGTLALNGSPFPPNGWHGDQTFRIAAIEQFRTGWGIPDFAYRGLSAHYPPLSTWFAARGADLLDLPSYEAQKYTTIAASVVAVVVGAPLWRLTLPRERAVLAALAPLVAAIWYHPAAWIAIAVAVPWWMWVLRLASDRDAPSAGRLAVAGALGAVVLTTYYYVLFICATHLLVVVAARRPRLRLRPLVAVAAGTAVCSAWYWIPLLLDIVDRGAFHGYQNRWLTMEGTDLPLPFLQLSARGVAMLLGLLYLAGTAARRTSWLLLTMAGAVYAWHLLGDITFFADLPLDTFRSELVLEWVLATGFFLGLGWAVGRARTLPARGGFRWSTALLVVGGVLVAGVAQQAARLPYGERQLGDVVPTARLAAFDEAVGGASETDGVVVLGDAFELYVFRPAHAFYAWNVNFSHPASEYEARTAFVESLSRVRDPAELHDLLRNNPYDRVDVVAGEPVEGGVRVRYTVDEFPEPNALRDVVIPRSALAEPYFHAYEGGGLAVFTLA